MRGRGLALAPLVAAVLAAVVVLLVIGASPLGWVLAVVAALAVYAVLAVAL